MRAAIVSGVGGRENNEDTVRQTKVRNKYCFVVADGMGGHTFGEIASGAAADAVIEKFKAEPGISRELLASYLDAAQSAVIAARKEHRSDMGTTIAVLVTDGVRAIWGNCGDSRIYRLKRHLINEVTEDHTVSFASFLSGEIKYSEIRYSPDQNKLLHALSNGEKFKPDFSEVVMLPPKSSFLLCTDGFWEYVTEDMMEKTRRRAATPRLWLSAMCEERKIAAPQDADNYSAIAVYI